VLTGGTVEAVMAWKHTFVPGGYGGAPVAMIGDVNYQDLSEKALAEVISEVVDAGDHARVRSRVAEGHASQSCSTRRPTRTCWWWEAVVTAASPTRCWAQ
jgi:hypothetical protein